MTLRSPALLLLLSGLLFSCRSKDKDTLDTSDTGSPDTDPSHFDLTISTSPQISTVGVVDWETTLDGLLSVRVEYGLDTSYGRVATAVLSAGPPYHTILLGLKGSTDYHLRMVAETSEGSFSSEDQLLSTGPVPAALPNLSVESLGDHWQGFLVNSLVGSTPGPVIFDADGDYVWWHEAEEKGPFGGDGSGVMLGRSRLSADGTTMLYTYCNVLGMANNAIHRVTIEGVEIDSVQADYAHHDFVELPDGAFAYLSYDPHQTDGERILGDRIMEVSRAGLSHEVFNIWDHPEYVPEERPGPGLSWPHANALDYLPDEDAFLIGLLFPETILKIDRESGEILWSIGGVNSDWTVNDSTDLFDRQHQFELLDESILVFVNGGMAPGSSSYALEIGFEEGTIPAEELWRYQPETSINCTNLGDVDRLESGNTLVTFSSTGIIHELDPLGEPVWTLTGDVGGALAYSTLYPDLDIVSWQE